MKDVLTNLIGLITSQYVHESNHHIAHLKLIQCQSHLDKATKQNKKWLNGEGRWKRETNEESWKAAPGWLSGLFSSFLIGLPASLLIL